MNEMILSLKEKTGFGIFICKKALIFCDYQFDLAFNYLKLKSQPVVRYKISNNQKIKWNDFDYKKEALKYKKV